ncbi:hypothetical protein AUK40_02980 [Candidatus Wirthbacteria bacterium CG2_30_54_11]|uniref:Uncharacterized protein n=1 Tax=Candidatus Wirthbacteria bacterium CG2_30_54_11 TaxID=1817892 RepID=A0A1J5IWM6_9BACT|nr:MAG: hypothetical protein AUK40_02980 [Candidatus Wirthbacteria bacterium CG2_30_54_11]
MATFLKNRRYVLAGLVLLLAASLALKWYVVQNQNTDSNKDASTSTGTTSDKAPPLSTPLSGNAIPSATTAASDTAPADRGDLTPLLLHIGETDLTFEGYPYVSKNATPNLFHLVFISPYLTSPDFEYGYTDPAADWVGTYALSRTDNFVYIPIGRTSTDQPIMQTMRLLTETALAEKVTGCSTSAITIEEMSATRYDCSSATGTNRNNSAACSLPVGSDFLFYEQHSADSTVTGDMCAVLRSNAITSVTKTAP